MKKGIMFFAVFVVIGVFWVTAALAGGWRAGDFTDQAFLADLQKAIKAYDSKSAEKRITLKKSGEETKSLPSIPFNEIETHNW